MNTLITRNTWRILSAISALLFAMSAQAASFDCAKARTKVEHIICDDAEISKLDVDLNESYKAALKDKSQAASIKKSQKLWMKERSSCADSDCLEATYRSRIDELKPDQERERFLTVLSKDKQLCDAYKHYVEQETETHGKYDYPVMCSRPFGKDYPEFTPVKWREIKPKDYPELSGQAAMYIEKWPWKYQVENWPHKDRSDIAAPLSDAWFHEGVKAMEFRYANGALHMWLGEADIGNTGHIETLLKVEVGRCGDVPAHHPSLWKLPVMVVDSITAKIDTVKSEWVLGVSVPQKPVYITQNFTYIPGIHEIGVESYDVFSREGFTYFDRIKDAWVSEPYGASDERFASYSVYKIINTKPALVCRYKFKK